jgi:hypothetical protein
MTNQGSLGRAGKLLVAMVLVTGTWSCAGQIRAAAARTASRESAAAALSDLGGAVAAYARGATDASHLAQRSPETHAPRAIPAATHLRRLTGREMNRALVEHAKDIIQKHHQDAFGTEIPFEVAGKRYVGRVERHYHPEGGPLKPWGFHPGCSLFAVEVGG